MNAEAADIERIVREVLERLSVPGPASFGGSAATRSESTRDEVVVSARVVTLDALPDLKGVKRLIAQPRAVITPAVRDLLRQRGIDVAYAIGKREATARLAVGATERGRDVAGLLQGLTSEGIEVQRIASAGLGNTVAELADLVSRSGFLGLIWTAQAVAATCLANRHPGVRAVTGNDIKTLRDAIQAVGANVLIVRRGSLSDYQLRRQISEFCRSPRPCCPAEYERWLT